MRTCLDDSGFTCVRFANDSGFTCVRFASVGRFIHIYRKECEEGNGYLDSPYRNEECYGTNVPRSAKQALRFPRW